MGFSLPCAFTPTCSSTHLPGFEEKYDELKLLGVDEVYSVSVNDAFTMYRWSKQLGVSNVKILLDDNSNFTRGMDRLVKKHHLDFGEPWWRYSRHVVNGELKKRFAEDGKIDNSLEDPFECSDVNTLLSYLKSAAVN